MYSDPRLDTPPPTSQFRRPWSPDPYEPLPPTLHRNRNDQAHHVANQQQYDYAVDPTRYPEPRQQLQRREPSDVSIEALDLADYTRTLRARQAAPYAAYYPESDYPPSPTPSRPLASRDSIQAPSLASRDTLTSNVSSSRPHGRNPSHRPFSLPPPARYASSSRNRHTATPTPFPDQSSPQFRPPSDAEIDISQFPPWSRNWYDTRTNLRPSASLPDIYTPLPHSHFDSPKQSPFDPGYVHKDSLTDLRSSSNPYGLPSLEHESTRDLLPWSSDPPDHPVDPLLKEERIRMLEREFGPKAKGKSTEGDFLDENGKPLVGTIDPKGRLVTQGSKKRIATRILQIILALAAAIPGIYAALVIKPKDAPPPAGKPAAYILYILSVITFLLLLYLFLFRPCCCAGKRHKGLQGSNPLVNGMMVLPVQGLPGGKKTKNKGGKGRKGRGSVAGDVQVNLIVDPSAFGQREEESDENDDGEWNDSATGVYESASGAGRKRRRRARRRSVFAGLAMEEEWKRARSWLKKIAVFDVLGALLWGAAFVLILLGKRCPSGGFEGWCNAYNVSSAAACLLCVAFCMSTFFNVKDLHSSKVSPRTRT